MTTPPSRHPRLMQRLVAALAALACAVLTLTSCRSDTAAPTTPPTTHVSTQAAPTSGASTASASPSPVDEAIEVYIAYQEALEDLMQAGGTTKTSDAALAWVMGPERRIAKALARDVRKNGMSMTSGDMKVVGARASLKSEGRVRVTACLDLHTVVLTDATGQHGPLMDFARDVSEVRLDKDGRWKVYSSKQTEAKSC